MTILRWPDYDVPLPGFQHCLLIGQSRFPGSCQPVSLLLLPVIPEDKYKVMTRIVTMLTVMTGHLSTLSSRGVTIQPREKSKYPRR